MTKYCILVERTVQSASSPLLSRFPVEALTPVPSRKAWDPPFFLSQTPWLGSRDRRQSGAGLGRGQQGVGRTEGGVSGPVQVPLQHLVRPCRSSFASWKAPSSTLCHFMGKICEGDCAILGRGRLCMKQGPVCSTPWRIPEQGLHIHCPGSRFNGSPPQVCHTRDGFGWYKWKHFLWHLCIYFNAY